MSFLAMILALVLLQVWGSGSRVQGDDWFAKLQDRVCAWGGPAELRLALLVLVPALLAHLVLGALEPVLFGLLWIALAAFLLLYAMGRGDFQQLLERYRSQCQNEDFEAAYLTTLSELGWGSASDDPVSAAGVHSLVQRGFFYEGYQRWFAVLFYFVLLGPAGALAYRLLQLCRGRMEPGLVDRCLFLVDWVPARLLAASFSLTGDFVGSRDELLEVVVEASAEAPQLLQKVGEAALDFDASALEEGGNIGLLAAEQNHAMAGLLFRSAACWVAVISLLVLFL